MLIIGLTPGPPDVLLREVEERPGDVRETGDEPPVEVREAEKLLHVLPVDRRRPCSNSGYLHRVHTYVIVGDDHAEVLDLRPFELTLFQPEEEFVLPEAPEDFGNDPAVRPEVGVGDEDVVQVNHDISGENEILEDVVHHRLERRR